MLAALLVAATLFPAPLHLTREISDPISGTTSRVEEYCHGNRVVSVNGKRTAIADYEKGTLTTIDFERGTYSVAQFDELARAWGAKKNGGSGLVKISSDEHHELTREAVEVLLGVAYPSPADTKTQELLSSLRAPRVATNSAGAAAQLYALPVEQVFAIDNGDAKKLEVTNRVVRVGSEPAPAEVMIVPPGAKLVESHAIATKRMLDVFDGLGVR